MELYFHRWGSHSLSHSPQTAARNASQVSDINDKSRIILLHGLGGTGALWRPIAASLEEEFDILAPDQRGHGRSQQPTLPGGRLMSGYSPVDYAQDVVELMERLSFHPAIIVGHSMGVRTACAIAHLKPDWVRGLVLVDLGFSGIAGGGMGDELAHFLQILPPHFSSRAEARSFMEEHCPDAAIAQYLMAVSLAATPDQGGGIGFPFDHAALIRTLEEARGTTIRHWIEAAALREIPTLALRGSLSKVWSKEQFEAEHLHFSQPQWKEKVQLREITGAGHGLPFEKRSEFLEALRDFHQKLCLT
ncbi:MAG: alpha/beta hydrolase [Bdellovibrionales bacterium]|nr:alpha/beta hydrolase [Bdellovibrionales bacterium]